MPLRLEGSVKMEVGRLRSSINSTGVLTKGGKLIDGNVTNVNDQPHCLFGISRASNQPNQVCRIWNSTCNFVKHVCDQYHSPYGVKY